MITLIASLALALAPEPAGEPPELLGGDPRAPKVYVIQSSHIPADIGPRHAPPISVIVDVRAGEDRRDRDRRDRPRRRDDRGGGGRFDDAAPATNESED